MNIRDATMLAKRKDGWIKKRDRTEAFSLYVAAGSFYRSGNPDEAGEEVSLDARDCVGDDWYVVDEHGNEISIS